MAENGNSDNKPVKKVGRKKKYHEDFPLIAKGLARKGLNDKQIAAKLGIGLSAYYQFQLEFPEFSEALKEGKMPVDIEVENQLLRRAIGFEYTEQEQINLTTPAEIKKVKDAGLEVSKANKIVVRQRVIKRYALPDVTAQIFWLKNRLPRVWRDRRENVNANFDLTLEDIQELLPDD